VSNKKGSEVNIARVRKLIIVLHSKDSQLFPSSCADVLGEEVAETAHRENLERFPLSSALLRVNTASIKPIDDCLADAGLGLNLRQSFCYALGNEFHTLLVFEKGIKRNGHYPHPIQELFLLTAREVFMIAKQNTMGIFASGLDRTLVPSGYLVSERGYLRAHL